MFEISSFSTFSSTFDVINLYHFGPSDRSVVVSHCNFNLCSLEKYLLNLLSTDYVLGPDLGVKEGE